MSAYAVQEPRPADADSRVSADAAPSMPARPSLPERTHQMWIRVYDVCPHEGTRTDHTPTAREGL